MSGLGKESAYQKVSLNLVYLNIDESTIYQKRKISNAYPSSIKKKVF